VVSTLLKLQKEGKIKHFGVCNFSVNSMESFRTTLKELKEKEREGTRGEVPGTGTGTETETGGEVASVNQVPYNLLWRAIEFEIVPYALKHQVGLFIYSPLQQGLLTGRYLTPEDVPLGIARSRHFHKDRSPNCRHGEEGAEKETFEGGLRRRRRRRQKKGR
jgi:aryl-alcohol dehydrogenase-like predicted oxidoreductase